MNKLNILKKSINIIVCIGTGNIIKDIIEKNTDTPESVTEKVTHTAGAFALGGLISAKTAEYTDAKIDEIAASWTASSINPANRPK